MLNRLVYFTYHLGGSPSWMALGLQAVVTGLVGPFLVLMPGAMPFLQERHDGIPLNH